jgi:hypothetical protein
VASRHEGDICFVYASDYFNGKIGFRTVRSTSTPPVKKGDKESGK